MLTHHLKTCSLATLITIKEEVREILATLETVYGELFPQINLRQWGGSIYTWLTQPVLDPTHSGRVTMDYLMKLVTTALEWTYAAGETNVKAETLKKAAQTSKSSNHTILYNDSKGDTMSTTNPSAQTALLVMDVQPSTVERYAQNSDLLPRLATTIAAARAANIPVLYVRVKFRQGYPEVSPRNKLFSGIKQRSSSFQGAMMAMEIHPAIAPLPTDIVVTKLRVSAFAGSDLEVLLRAQDIRHLVLCGIATSGVVLSTLREAADKDYGLTVLSDCCVDSDEEVQRVLLTKVFPRQAEVLTSEQWCEAIR